MAASFNFPHYFVQFRCCWDCGTCPPYGIQGFPHFRGFDCTQTYVIAFGTEQSVCNIVDGCYSGVSICKVGFYCILYSSYILTIRGESWLELFGGWSGKKGGVLPHFHSCPSCYGRSKHCHLTKVRANCVYMWVCVTQCDKINSNTTTGTEGIFVTWDFGQVGQVRPPWDIQKLYTTCTYCRTTRKVHGS